MKTSFKKLLFIFPLVVILPLVVIAVQKVFNPQKTASGKLANISVDASLPQTPINSQLWQNFAQGGEEPKDMLSSVISEISALSPQLIRVDHIYDYYNVYQSDGVYDFSRLDQVVKTILKTGAKPMLSLSYIPSSLSIDGQIISPPNNWLAWQNLVKATVEHYSGRNGLNINNVYYEVYNEPDLFGGWHYAKDPNYLTLYYHSSVGAQKAQSVNDFKIGGPAITGFYPNWIKALFEYASKNKLRVDFVSWHRYSENLSDYDNDFESLNQILTNYPDYFSVERMISEFGPESEYSSWYSNQIGAAHGIAVSTHLLGKVHRVFAFELKDGPEKSGVENSHQWGMITHETNGKKTKPRYQAYILLNKLTGNRLPLEGEGSWVSGIATSDNGLVKILLVNFDPNGKHTELVPVRVNNLASGSYQIDLDYLFTPDSKINRTVSDGKFFERISLSANDAVLITFTKK
jgi:xylan 1,4-beta-xylosidase